MMDDLCTGYVCAHLSVYVKANASEIEAHKIDAFCSIDGSDRMIKYVLSQRPSLCKSVELAGNGQVYALTIPLLYYHEESFRETCQRKSSSHVGCTLAC